MRLIIFLFLLFPFTSAFAQFEMVVDRSNYTLTLFQNGKKVHSQKVIVGKSSRPTPKMETTIRNIELNPVWDIPRLLDGKKRAQMKRNPKGMYDRGYRVHQGGREVQPDKIDWTKPVDIKQSAGPSNVLGRLMFVLDRSTLSQMHDTPSKHLFSRKNRRLSNGCIRLSQAHKLAAIVLGKSVDKVKQLIYNSGDETLIPVNPPIKVKVI